MNSSTSPSRSDLNNGLKADVDTSVRYHGVTTNSKTGAHDHGPTTHSEASNGSHHSNGSVAGDRPADRAASSTQHAGNTGAAASAAAFSGGPQPFSLAADQRAPFVFQAQPLQAEPRRASQKSPTPNSQSFKAPPSQKSTAPMSQSSAAPPLQSFTAPPFQPEAETKTDRHAGVASRGNGSLPNGNAAGPGPNSRHDASGGSSTSSRQQEASTSGGRPAAQQDIYEEARRNLNKESAMQWHQKAMQVCDGGC